MSENTPDPEIDDYLIAGWEKHVLYFDVSLKSNCVSVCERTQRKEPKNPRWKLSVTGQLMQLPGNKELKFTICTSLRSSPRKYVFAKACYTLENPKNDEVLMSHIRNHCFTIDKNNGFHLENIKSTKAKKLILRIAMVSETGEEKGLLDQMMTAQEMLSSGFQSPLATAQSDSVGDSIRGSNNGRASLTNSEVSRQKLLKPSSNWDRVPLWEKFSFTFEIIHDDEAPCALLKDTSGLRHKWDVIGEVKNAKNFISIHISTKLCESPRECVFIKFLFIISTTKGEILRTSECKRYSRLFHTFTWPLKHVPKDFGNILLKVLIMSDTYDGVNPNQSNVSICPQVGLINSDDDVIILESDHTQEGPGVQATIIDVCVNEKRNNGVLNGSCDDMSRLSFPDISKYVSSWESCIYICGISSCNKEQYLIQDLKFEYKPVNASNKWSLSILASDEKDSERETCISFKLDLNSTILEKVFAKFVFFVKTVDGMKVFQEKCCLKNGKSLIHCLRSICLPPIGAVIKVVILSEAPEDSDARFFSDMLLQTTEDKMGDTLQKALIQTAEAELIVNVRKLVKISPVIRKNFEQKEKDQNHTVIQMNEYSSVAVCQLLSYINGSKNIDLGLKSATELLQLSIEYEIDSLKRDCEQYLISILTEENAMSLLLLADSFSAPNLKDRAVRLICKSSETFAQKSGYEELNDRPHLLKEILISVATRSGKRKKSMEKNDKKKVKREEAGRSFVRNLEEEYMTGD